MEDDISAFKTGIKELTCASLTSAKPVISVSIAGVSRDVLIDSGFASNLPIIASNPSGSKQSL